MTAVTILLVAIFGTLNVINAVSLRQREDRALEMLADNSGIPKGKGDGQEAMQEHQEQPPADRRGKGPEQGLTLMERMFGTAQFSEDQAMGLRYFLAYYSGESTITSVDVDHIMAVDETAAKKLAKKALTAGKSTGTSGSWRYLVDSGQSLVVFLDVTEQLQRMHSVLLMSLFVAALSWVVTLLIVILLSRRAIAPIERNIVRQRQFVTNAGHEIRTPLAIISANLDALELFNGKNKWTGNIRSQTLRLEGLMSNLLTLSKMDENGLQLPRESVDLSSLVRESIDPFRQGMENRSLTLTAQIEENVRVRINRASMAQLISILMDNAIKYTSQGGEVRISLSRRGGQVVLTQSNNVDEEGRVEDPGRLFERFYRADQARTQQGKSGYGIGLSAALAIAQANEGKISAAYDREGRMVFTLILAEERGERKKR